VLPHGREGAALWPHGATTPMMDSSTPTSPLVDLLARLQAALGDRYTIERELTLPRGCG